LKDAVFIPPTHDEIDELMQDLELLIHTNTIQIPELIKAAIVHYQFETIHPFFRWQWPHRPFAHYALFT
jgi:Fic family protein